MISEGNTTIFNCQLYIVHSGICPVRYCSGQITVYLCDCRGGFLTLPSRLSHLDGVKDAHTPPFVAKCAHRGRVLPKGGPKTLPYRGSTISPTNSNLTTAITNRAVPNGVTTFVRLPVPRLSAGTARPANSNLTDWWDFRTI